MMMISRAHQLLDPGGSRPWVGDQPHILLTHLKRIVWWSDDTIATSILWILLMTS